MVLVPSGFDTCRSSSSDTSMRTFSRLDGRPPSPLPTVRVLPVATVSTAPAFGPSWSTSDDVVPDTSLMKRNAATPAGRGMALPAAADTASSAPSAVLHRGTYVPSSLGDTSTASPAVAQTVGKTTATSRA